MLAFSADIAHTSATILPVFLIAYLLEMQRARQLHFLTSDDAPPFPLKRWVVVLTVIGSAAITVLLATVPDPAPDDAGWWARSGIIAGVSWPAAMMVWTMFKADKSQIADAAAERDQDREARLRGRMSPRANRGLTFDPQADLGRSTRPSAAPASTRSDNPHEPAAAINQESARPGH